MNMRNPPTAAQPMRAKRRSFYEMHQTLIHDCILRGSCQGRWFAISFANTRPLLLHFGAEALEKFYYPAHTCERRGHRVPGILQGRRAPGKENFYVKVGSSTPRPAMIAGAKPTAAKVGC